MKHKTLEFALSFVLVGLWPVNIVGSSVLAADRQSEILNATTLLSDPQGMPVYVDSNLELTVRSTQLASLRTRAFQIRVFRGNADSLIREGWQVDGDCFIYVTTLFPFSKAEFDARLFVAAVNKYWLSHAGQGGLSSQDYVLVFEDRTSQDGILRIKRSDAAAYFKRSLHFVVTPRVSPSEDDVREVLRYFRERNVVLAEKVQKSARDCLGLRTQTLAPITEAAVAVLEPCTRDDG